jgi:hypothetical protein
MRKEVAAVKHNKIMRQAMQAMAGEVEGEAAAEEKEAEAVADLRGETMCS